MGSTVDQIASLQDSWHRASRRFVHLCYLINSFHPRKVLLAIFYQEHTIINQYLKKYDPNIPTFHTLDAHAPVYLVGRLLT